MCAKNHLLIFSSFLDIWENVEWPRFFGPPCTAVQVVCSANILHVHTIIHFTQSFFNADPIKISLAF